MHVFLLRDECTISFSDSIGQLIGLGHTSLFVFFYPPCIYLSLSCRCMFELDWTRITLVNKLTPASIHPSIPPSSEEKRETNNKDGVLSWKYFNLSPFPPPRRGPCVEWFDSILFYLMVTTTIMSIMNFKLAFIYLRYYILIPPFSLKLARKIRPTQTEGVFITN